MNITVLENTPVYQPPRRLAAKERNFVEQQISEWLQDGTIRPSFSNYASPIVVVKKKDGNLRLCVDYRALNKKLYRDRFPIPNIEDQIDQLYDATYFSTLDLTNGFFHVPVDENSIQYTAFITPSGHFEFLKMPFGLCNSPSTFQRFINFIFQPLIQNRKILIYIDDLIIPSRSEEEGIDILSQVLQISAEYGLNIKWKKCDILKTKIEYLGYMISQGKIEPSPIKSKAVVNFPEPKNIKQLQRFLGLAGYFRKFIENFSMKASPLYNLLKNNTKFNFDNKCKNSFQILKDSLSCSPVLSIFKPGIPTELHTDACSIGFGAVLMQTNPNDEKIHPVAYMSKKTSIIQQKYSSYELEILAVVEAVKKFRSYLLGHPFKLVTDCKAFEQTLKKKDLCTRIARWIMLLEDYEYTVEHRKASQLRHADALSRIPASMIIQIDKTILQQLKQAQNDDENIQTIKKVLEVGPYKNYIIQNELLCKNKNGIPLFVVPQAMEDFIIKRTHEQGHFNLRKMQELIEKEFYIKNLGAKVETCIKNCIQCILATKKEGRQEGYLHPINKDISPLDTFHIDHLGPLSTTKKGYKHIFSVVDSFTKFLWLFPVKTLAASESIKKLEIISETFGNPNRIIADQAGAFTSKEFRDYCTNEGIELLHTTTGVPRGNGQVERTHRIVIAALTKLSIDEPDNWYKHVGKVQTYLNSSFHRSIAMTPFKLLTGVEMKIKDSLHIRDIVEQEVAQMYHDERNELREKAKTALLQIQEENRRTYNKKRKPPHRYRIGELVAIERTQLGTGLKIKAKYLGPYQNIQVKDNDRYNVIKVGCHEGPATTSSSVDKMKPWSKVCS